MEIWILILVVIFAYTSMYKLSVKRQEEEKCIRAIQHESLERLLELHTVSSIAGSLVAAKLSDAAQNEQLEAASIQRMEARFSDLPSNGKPAQRSREEADEIVEELDEVISNLSMFYYSGRKRYLELAWEIYGDVKADSKKMH